MAIMLAVGFVAFSLMGLNDTIFGEFLRPAIGEPKESGLFGNLAIGLVMSMLFVGNIVLIGFLPFRYQVIVVWIELLILFLSFFYNFGAGFCVHPLQGLVHDLARGVYHALYLGHLNHTRLYRRYFWSRCQAIFKRLCQCDCQLLHVFLSRTAFVDAGLSNLSRHAAIGVRN